MAQVVVCCAQKGGCAKTVTVHNLSVALARIGKKVLAIDFDTQASLTTCFGITPEKISLSIADLMYAQISDSDITDKSEFIHHCSGLDLIPSSARLSAISEMMHHEIGCERFLRDILDGLRINYDYIIVDTGPKLDNLSINALIAADQLIIPANPQYLSTVGLQSLLKTVNKIHRRFNPNIQVTGILLTMCEQRTNLCRIISTQIREEYNNLIPVFKNFIPMNVKVGEAIYFSKSVLEYAPSSKAARAYAEFAVEFDRKASGERSHSGLENSATASAIHLTKKERRRISDESEYGSTKNH